MFSEHESDRQRPDAGRSGPIESTSGHHWSFLSNHGHVLVSLAADPHARLRDLANQVGITERAVHRLLAEMEAAGVIERHREGRRNHYSIRRGARLRHPIESHRSVADLLDMITGAYHPGKRVA